MKYSCEIIRDLIPLYIDGVCAIESENAIKEHISECFKCRKYYEEMSESNSFMLKSNNSEEEKMTKSLKKVKTKINKKIRNTVIGATSAVLAFTVCFHVLFNVPIMSVDKDKVNVTAEVYPLSELPQNIKTNDDSVKISTDESDNSDVYTMVVPEHSNMQIGVSENAMNKDGFATVVTTNSDYFLKSINWETKGDAIYISAFKTTILNNKAKNHQKRIASLMFSEINKIIFIEEGTETVLWEK